jgi:hypothetical protein
MSILKKRKRDSVTATLPLPVPPALKDRYRKLQTQLDAGGFESLNEVVREKLEVLLSDIEKDLNRASA